MVTILFICLKKKKKIILVHKKKFRRITIKKVNGRESVEKRVLLALLFSNIVKVYAKLTITN